MEIRNHTPFPAVPFLVGDRAGAPCLVVVVKGTWRILERGDLAVAEDPAPVEPADRYRGDPAKTSIAVPGDVLPEKPGTDFLLEGSVAVGARPFVDVQFGVADLCRRARVFGDRVWEKVLGISRISKPRPVEAVPLVWERAFGGRDLSADDPARHESEPRNPVGRGFRAKKSALPVEGEPLPNVEDPAAPIKGPRDRPVPAGFGALAPAWTPRISFAGTYDAAWSKARRPLLPADFDPRFFDRAPPGMTRGSPPPRSAPVTVVGAGRRGALGFALPELRVSVEATFPRRRAELPLHLDTVLVDADRERVVLSAHGLLRVPGEEEDIVRVTVRLLPGGLR